MQDYTFIKDRSECGNIEGCKFIGDYFKTQDPEIAERLRKSATFNRTVHEFRVDEPPKPEPEPISEPEPEPVIHEFKVDAKDTSYNIMSSPLADLTYNELKAMAKQKNLRATGTKIDLLIRLEKAANGH